MSTVIKRVGGKTSPLLIFINGRCPHLSLITKPLHVPPILTSYFVQRMCYLPKAAIFYRFHQFGKQVAVLNRHLL